MSLTDLVEQEKELRWQEEKAAMAEYIARREAFAAEERARAYEAVNKALATYRWYGWTNIVNTVRLFIQSVRWRLRAKKQ